ncbi:mannose-6-phosphate isomerase-like protein (cupin superfamily) [Methanohalophilus levihalophilus]|uniref:cupin domain-containing protein n=1 Tax=Methanohalophilus levihalophilus TaxID=1431282 RepID=UPI001AE52702|nr:cupin domain-containing protein [Methanohalophilus levihalophilus]MBP2031020.1 mannose-6-phosphate isomerase-like protein (cupin superfamily) [Methanohalophilus levihalophilus]
MIITEVKNADAKSNPHGVDVRSLYNSEHGQMVHITLNPDQKLLKHVTPVDAAVYILEGEAVVEVGDEEEQVGKDTLIEFPKGIPHLVRNAGKAPLRFLVVKMPRPEKSTKFL